MPPTTPPIPSHGRYIYRADVFEHVLVRVRACVTLQRRARGFVKRSAWVRYQTTRYHAASRIQRIYRISQSMKVARYLRVLQRAEWEQLWEPKRQLCYYYNRVTQASSYKEPASGLFRPLVRDRRSDALVRPEPFVYIPTPPLSSLPPLSLPHHDPFVPPLHSPCPLSPFSPFNGVSVDASVALSGLRARRAGPVPDGAAARPLRHLQAPQLPAPHPGTCHIQAPIQAPI